MERYRVLRIDEQLYGCEELPEGQPVLCDVLLEDAAGQRRVVAYPDAELTRLGINEGDAVLLCQHTLIKCQEEHMKPIQSSALIGLGALGILFGRKMPGVQVIADAGRIARYSASPVVCNGEECRFDYITPAEGKPVDLILIAVKATVLQQAIRDIEKFVGPDTVILSVLNGITSEEAIEAVYPGHTLWSVAIGMDATRVGRSLTFGAAGRIQFGEKNGAMTERVQRVAEYLDACGIANEPCSDILYKQWSKLMVNDGLNQAAAAFDLPYGGLTQPGPAYDKMFEAMEEVIKLSQLEGVNLPDDNAKAMFESMAPTFKPDGMPSMRQDVLAHRPTEIEEFAGVVRRLARKHGMPTPANDFFYEKIKEIEASWKKCGYTFIDLFAGIGGMRLAFESAGGRCVYSNEWNKFSQQTYFSNFGVQPDDDITKVPAENIPDHDILVAGFPCQPFSIAGVSKKNSLGRATGFEDKTQGTLFFDVCRVLKAKRPKAFMLENVKNLCSHDKGRTFQIIQESLQELNYKVFFQVLDGKGYVPQHRERIVIVGFDKNRYGNNIDFSFDLHPLQKQPAVRDILEKEVSEKYTLSDKLWLYLQNYAAKHREAGNGFGYGIAPLDGITRTLSARYYKDGSEILIEQNGKNPRRLTPRECARLQGFPDSFKIPVSDTQAYRQFGNSVVVPLMADVANLIVANLKSLDADSKIKVSFSTTVQQRKVI